MTGRPKAIKTPEELWQHFCDYRKDVKANPRKVVDYVGKDARKVTREIERPLTLVGFMAYVMRVVEGINSQIRGYLGEDRKNGSNYDEFGPVAHMIRAEISADQIDGGVTGQYNGPLVAKLNHLVDKREETRTNVNVQIMNIDPLQPLPGEEDQIYIEPEEPED